LLVLALRGGALRNLVASGTRARCLLALGAVGVAVYQAAFFGATARTGVAIGAAVTIGAAPVFAGVLSLLTGRRNRPGARWLTATAAAVAGCVMLATSGHGSGANMAGIALALLASFCYAVYAVTASYLISNGAQDRAVIGAMFGGAAVLLLPVLFISPMGWMATGRGLAVGGYLAVLTTSVAYFLYARGLRTTPVTAATTLGLAEPAIAAVLGLTVLGERLGTVGFAGLAVLALGLVTLARPAPGRRTAAGSEYRPTMPYSDGGESSQIPAPASRNTAQAAWRPSAGAPRLEWRRRRLRQPGAAARPGADRVRARR
jgi:DME family drug/metabolite transporter